MKDYFVEMFAFDRWANAQILRWLETHPVHAELTAIFAHLVAENQPWLHLLRGEEVPPTVDPEPDWSLAVCRTHLGAIQASLAEFVRSTEEAELSAIVRSPGPAGRSFENTAGEILTHLLNHAEHHRGQILGIVAKETGEYIPSLYMSYLRKVPSDQRGAF